MIYSIKRIMSSHLLHSDADGRIIGSGGYVVRKEHSHAEYQDVEWDVNRRDGWTFANAGSDQLKFYLRRKSRNEMIEDVFVEWQETIGLDSVDAILKFPTFFHLIEQVRVLINNVEVVDIKHHEIIQNLYRTSLHTKRAGSEREADYHWGWIQETRNQMLIGNNAYHLPIVQPQDIGVRSFRATFMDILGGVFESLPLCNEVNFIEIQMRFLSPLYTSYLGGNPSTNINEVLHNNIRVYSRHKLYDIPIPKRNFVLHHQDCEVLRINPPFNQISTGVGRGRIEVDISQNFIGEVDGIQRIIVYKQETTPTADSHRHFKVDNIVGLSLRRNGYILQASDFFYRNVFNIAYQTERYYKRRSNGIHPGHAEFIGDATRAVPGDVGFGQTFPQVFIDTTTLTKTINEGNNMESSVIDANEGIDNGKNLILRIEYEGDINTEGDIQLIVLLEFHRFSKLFPNGHIAKIK